MIKRCTRGFVMTEDNQNTESQDNATADNNEEFLRKQKAKTEALMRYINDQVAVQKPAPVVKKTLKEKIKEAVVGIAKILYMIFFGVLFDKKVRSRLGIRIVMILLTYLFAYWMSNNFDFDYEKEYKSEDMPRNIMYEAEKARNK